jgi:predicted NACHT family NTPase
MIATVHRYRSSLPGRRVELYAEICEVFLGQRQEARGLLSDLTPAQKIRVLRQLAFTMMDKELREINTTDAIRTITKPLSTVSPNTKGDEFLKSVENSSGLLVESESGRYGFSHLTFQEYLTAVHMIESRLEKELIEHVNETWWRETIRLFCAQTDASTVIFACLKSKTTASLSLAIECMREAREVSPEVRDEYQAMMDKGLEDPNPEIRRTVASAYLDNRLR